jgi:DNA-binding NtrC family response regulator
VRIDFRLICSTNRDLSRDISSGHFREDLFYRINVVRINLPPLRERKDDISLLTSSFLKEYCIRENKSLEISSEVMDLFHTYPWPGNIRQLRNVIERATVLARGKVITVQELSDELRQFAEGGRPQSRVAIRPLREMEEEAIRTALFEYRGNKSKVATMLGISRKALYKKLLDMNR